MISAMKGVVFIWILFALVISGCTTVRREPVPVSEVHFFERKGSFIIAFQSSHDRPHGFTGRPEIHFNYRGRADGVTYYQYPVSELTGKAQYIVRVLWSGTIPEMDVPEDQSVNPGLAPLPDVPVRVKEAIKKDAAAKGANLVILDIGSGNIRWVLEGGRLQPEYLFYSKAYYSTIGR